MDFDIDIFYAARPFLNYTYLGKPVWKTTSSFEAGCRTSLKLTTDDKFLQILIINNTVVRPWNVDINIFSFRYQFPKGRSAVVI